MRWLVVVAAAVWGQDSRIVGGVDVQPAFKYPWMVAIFRYGEYWCGGTLIAQNMVITAAHCMGGAKAPLRNYEVQLHRHNLELSPGQEKSHVFKVTKRWIAAGFDPEALYNDVAVIQTNSKNKGRTSITLDRQLWHKDGFRVMALGWGALGELKPNHPILQEAWLPLTSRHECSQSYKAQLNYTVLPSQLCAGFRQGGRDSCQGDSGGPLFTYINDHPVLVGVTSNGLSCAKPNTPGIYSRVASFYPWLMSVLNGLTPPTPDQD
ncbi:hypothetical protein DSO57_1028484 [Entomophthora muscae]|uniref:Uncharacterized protein n=2 Tax=Entomophthora muscae TaxID=34485 RepID=A0ACC2ULW0_9FUNG|nr:hypothetical protein DSO57_1003324 [Entomophthora muscae]KAJ9087904.1 hypothetical protein DSO57_1028484 [Entomophthora muscae]